jgi:tetratricopeptide (TPR) repeat protein
MELDTLSLENISKGDSLFQSGQSVKALELYKNGASLIEKMARLDNNANWKWKLAQSYERMAGCIEPVTEKITLLEGGLRLREIVIKEYENNVTVPVIISSYGSLSWYYLFAREFQKAEESALNGINLAHKHQMDSTALWINTNLAHALLFQGKYDEAKAIYLKYKDQPYPLEPEKTFGELFLKDLDELEKAGITHSDMTKIKALLNS